MSYPSDNRGYYAGESSGGYGAYSPDSTGGGRDDPPFPRYLAFAVILLGAASYLLSFGPVFGDGSVLWGVRFAVLAALAAAFGRLRRETSVDVVVAVLAAAGFLDALATLLTAPEATSPGWALTVIVVVDGLQMICAIGMLALGSGIARERATQQSQYDAYADYYAQMAYYSQYGQQSEQPEGMRRNATGQAQQQVAATQPERARASQAGNYADYIGNRGSERTAAVNPSAAYPDQRTTQPGPQPGLPTVGRAEGSAQQYGERGESEFRPSTSH